MRKLIYIYMIAGGLMLSARAMAQYLPMNGFGGNISVGADVMNMHSVNDALPWYYPKMGNVFTQYGINLHYVIDNYVIEVEGMRSVSAIHGNDSLQIQGFAGHGLLNIGYIPYTFHNGYLYGLVGIGGATGDIAITEGMYRLPNSDNPPNPYTEIFIRTGSTVVNVAVGGNIYTHYGNDVLGGTSIGFRVGYMQALPAYSGTVFNTPTPADNAMLLPSGVYARLNIGLGKYWR